MATGTLGTLELAVMLAVVRLGDDAYGLSVRDDVSSRARHDYSVGAVYTTLHRLEDKGLVASSLSEPSGVRGGRARRQFTITAAGRRALVRAERLASSVWGEFGAAFLPEPT
jgi:PadR family transcriptional regulator, regulatory protein PadR